MNTLLLIILSLITLLSITMVGYYLLKFLNIRNTRKRNGFTYLVLDITKHKKEPTILGNHSLKKVLDSELNRLAKGV